MGPKGEVATCALLDGGATVTLIDSTFARALGIRGPTVKKTLRGLYGVEQEVSCERVRFCVNGPFGLQQIEHALVIPSLNLPSQSLSEDLAERINAREKIKLHAYQNAPLKILIGQDNWPLIMSLESRRLGNSGLVISRSLLGWSVHGFFEEEEHTNEAFNVNATRGSNTDSSNQEQQKLADLHRIVHEYLEIENLGVTNNKNVHNKDERAWAILEATSRLKGNEWETGLLWKPGFMPKIDSKSTALKRLHSLERKLDRNPSFASRYYREMDRLIESGYAEKVSKDVVRPREWYVPHFGVENANKPGKVRLVFDAAATTRGVSLNDLLETGPDLLESLIGVLLRFREYPVAVKADIKDMYLRVKVLERDRGAQRFLWRGADRHREPDVYENTSLFFGSKSSPCSAIYVKNKNAERFADEKPDAVRSIIKNSYMDDYLASGESIEEMRDRVRDVILINKEANFQLHGWASNCPRVVADVHDESKLKEKKASLCNDEERVLGLYWDRCEDTFSFNVGLSKISAEMQRGSARPTKREFFSTAMSVYDPLGLIAPFTLQSKLIMQDIWRSGVTWDSRIRDEDFVAWLKWLNNLVEMKNVKIPRCYLSNSSKYVKTELHVFCDASLKAFSAVAYLRSETADGTVHVSLVMSKSRVAPKKPMSVPRLELQAALLGARLAAFIESELGIKIDRRVFWIDSMTVKQWIEAGEPREKQMYVANRLGEIGEITKVEEWNWVPTELNPADDATRPSDKPMSSSDRFFVGPKFLLKPPNLWPKQKALLASEKKEIGKLEARKEYVGVTVINEPGECEIPAKVRLLGWRGIRKAMERVKMFFYRWVYNARQKAQNRRARRCKVRKQIANSRTAVSESGTALDRMIAAEKSWFRCIQSACFPEELDALKKGKEIHRNSKFVGLKPYIDDEGIMRARGRLGKFTSTLFQNRPIILDASHFATKLLIAEYHRLYNHANNETVINEMRQHFYIVGLRTRLRWLAKNCLTCRVRRAQPLNPPMADLPASRTAYAERPFSHCGIDYFGPMLVKIGRRREKRWGVLFTCMTTRAIHVEIAYTLTASSAIMAIQRMSARRGCPRAIYSDNGTNFVKANKELREAMNDLDTVKQKEFAEANRIKWCFNPPDAAHMGGAWERLIRSVKVSLHHALNEQVPTEEVLTTLLAEIEHMVNSRPLTHVSVDPNDEEALTPNHFLIGSSSGHLKLEKYEFEVTSPRKNFEIAQQLANSFWKRWLREYLPTLLPRQKWNADVPPLKVGDIVLISDYQMPRNMWRKGKIIEVLPNSTDNVVRVVKVRTGRKDFLRPASKLIKIFGPSD